MKVNCHRLRAPVLTDAFKKVLIIIFLFGVLYPRADFSSV